MLIFDDQDAGGYGPGAREGERGDGAAAGVVLEVEGGAEGEGGLVGDGQAEPEPVGGAGAATGEPQPTASGWPVSQAWAGLLSATRYRLRPLPGMAWTRLNPASIDSNSAR